MDFLHQILTQLNSIPRETWTLLIDAIITTVLPALAVSPIALALKKWWKINSDRLMVIIVAAGSVLSTLVVFALDSPDFPLPIQAWLTFATTQPVYYFFVKPLYLRISAWVALQIAEAAKLNEAKSAEVPVTGLPIGSTGDNTGTPQV